MKHSDLIKKEKLTLEQRGINAGSHFHVKFHDNSERTEHDTNWSDFSEDHHVEFLGGNKLVKASKYPIKSITITHDGLVTTIEAKEDEKVYQAIIALAIFNSDGSTTQRIVGRRIGKIKDGKVIEERLIDSRTREIVGVRM